tara:strand:- start:1031 stop:1588 length:558 start_codon:yes stop_codon:yes gene_type:complete
MRSSYKENKYENIFKLLVFALDPTRCVEFGILDGYSLKAMSDFCADDCTIDAYDIFEEFPGNAASYENLVELFKECPNVNIRRGDFYTSQVNFKDQSIDILHIDIANNGDTYKHVLEHYMPKLSDTGICVLEGGSLERDNVYWMKKYNKPKIVPVIEEIKKRYNVYTIDDHPSITFITKKSGTNE